MRYLVDRIEEDRAVCENRRGKQRVFFLSDLYADIREGDLFSYVRGKAVFLKEETEQARKEAAQMQNALFEKKE